MSSETLLTVKAHEPVDEGVYELGYPGLVMYVVFVDIVELHVDVDITQQTPNPAAQFPSALPPLAVHSEEV